MNPFTVSLPLPPTLSGMTKNVPGRGRPSSDAAKEFRRSALLLVQLAMRDQNVSTLTRPASVRMTIYPSSLRGDAANREKAVTDALVAAGLLRDDSFRWVHENCQALGEVDATNPRVEVSVWELWSSAAELDRAPKPKEALPWIPAPTRPKTLADLAKLTRPNVYRKEKP